MLIMLYIISDTIAGSMISAMAIVVIVFMSLGLGFRDQLLMPEMFEVLTSTSIASWSCEDLSVWFISLFAVMLGVIWVLNAYCDCPNGNWLEIKLCGFTLCTCGLMLASSFSYELLLFELIGLYSYRLIGHYWGRWWALRGSWIALCTNRVSDAILVVLMCRMYVSSHRWLSTDGMWCDVMLLGVMAKSLSVWFYMWLPDAMEGPTPVSSLLHSATLVLAGIILLMHWQTDIQSGILIAMTSVGWIAICYSYQLEADYKKLGAISTCIAVSMIWVCLWLGANDGWCTAILHAGYKCLLFSMMAGLLNAHPSQDLRAARLTEGSREGVLCALAIGIGLAGSYASTKMGIKLGPLLYGEHIIDPQSSGSWMLILMSLWVVQVLMLAFNTGTYAGSMNIGASGGLLILVTCSVTTWCPDASYTSEGVYSVILIQTLLFLDISVRGNLRLIGIIPPITWNILGTSAPITIPAWEVSLGRMVADGRVGLWLLVVWYGLY